ncbi:hypothetical protein [Ramlibacter humi]|uniref:Uncharacterized protein n=1 Tax=Ramlibacter humi TaxID=2530451 RepID=A0A4Z0C9L5_9BURK|nr:hypothetical protein [Ramlibacter humi]TFZ08367.1 hypothetical protein EZ216_04210 [Ramlibacter humi]
MSYDFLVFKPTVEVRSMADLSEEAMAPQQAAEVMAALSRLYPLLQWRDTSVPGAPPHFGAQYEDGETWYEFSVESPSSLAWSIRTSHRATQRAVVAQICRTLGCLAFDGQAMTMIGPDGKTFATG